MLFSSAESNPSLLHGTQPQAHTPYSDVIGHIKEHPTVHFLEIPQRTQSMTTLTQYFREFLWLDSIKKAWLKPGLIYIRTI